MSDMSLPVDYPIVPPAMFEERQLVRLVRELAMDMREIDQILDDFRMSRAEFEALQKDERFGRMLASELSSWGAATNAHERVKAKSAAMIEDYLPELYARLNDRSENLMGKAKMLEFIAKLAGWGIAENQRELAPGDRVVVQINLGADAQLNYEKRLPAKVIDHEPSVEMVNASPDNI